MTFTDGITSSSSAIYENAYDAMDSNVVGKTISVIFSPRNAQPSISIHPSSITIRFSVGVLKAHLPIFFTEEGTCTEIAVEKSVKMSKPDITGLTSVTGYSPIFSGMEIWRTLQLDAAPATIASPESEIV